MNYRVFSLQMALASQFVHLYHYKDCIFEAEFQVYIYYLYKSHILQFDYIKRSKTAKKLITFVAPNTDSLKSIVMFITLVSFIAYLYAPPLLPPPPNISFKISSNPLNPALPPWNPPLNWLKISYWLNPPAPP